MKVEAFEGGETERLLTAGMILSRTVLGRIAARWQKDGLFSNRWANIVAQLAVDHYRRHGKSPRRAIISQFGQWASRHNADGETVEVVDRFLGAVLDEHVVPMKEINSEYLIDLAGSHFTKVAARKLADKLTEAVQANRVDMVDGLVSGYQPVDLGEEEDINFFHDKEAHRAAFEDKQAPLFQYSGKLVALNKFFGNALARENFIAYTAPEKRGKTYHMLAMAFTAALQRRRVAFFEIGDLSRNQIMRRFQSHICQAPHRAKPGGVQIPTKIILGSGEPDVAYEQKKFPHDLSWKQLGIALKRTKRDLLKSDDEFLKLRCCPAGYMSVQRLQDTILKWRRSGWVPDMIVIDYADLLATPTHLKESRDKINAVWESLRALSVSERVLIVTATQANRAAYTAKTLRMEHSSEDKRKLSHVTGMAGLSCTSTEKRKGLIRYNWMVLREDDFDTERCVYVAGCLAIGHPCIVAKEARAVANVDSGKNSDDN